MTNPAETLLAFDRLNEGNQIYLSDGSVWRTGTKYRAIALGWSSGDQLEMSKDEDMFHDQLITNLRTRTSLRAGKSARLDEGIHRWLRT